MSVEKNYVYNNPKAQINFNTSQGINSIYHYILLSVLKIIVYNAQFYLSVRVNNILIINFWILLILILAKTERKLKS